MRNLIACAVVLGLTGSGLAETWTVDDDGPADFDTIQAAVDAASSGDVIIVEPGAYTSEGPTVVVIDKAVELRSSSGSGLTIIDGQSLRQCMSISPGLTSATIVDGFHLRNGTANVGGGIRCSSNSPTITNCLISGNTTTSTTGGGGGLYCSGGASPRLENCVIVDNSGSYGGAIHVNNSAPILDSCLISGNTASAEGGGIYVFEGNAPFLVNTTVCGNLPEQVVTYGNQLGDGGGNIISETCPDGPGACCTGNEVVCVSYVEEDDCLLFGGEWIGPGTSCDSAACPETCLGDVTGDGQVNVNDLLTVIANWNSCP